MLVIDRDNCLICAGCICLCPEAALYMDLTGLQVVDAACTLCGICVRFCPVQALAVVEETSRKAESRP